MGRLRQGLRILKPRQFALRAASCPFCGPSLFVRLFHGEGGIRCLRCAASTVHLSLGVALHQCIGDLSGLRVCELSARGPLAGWLQRSAGQFSGSEYFADVAPGTIHDGVRCEDVQRLSYADAAFDLVLHTEVLEHVPDDARAFAELHRVLRPGGHLLFTVPLDGEVTVERVRAHGDGTLEHLREPSYHLDPLRRGAGVLVFRDYGRDVVTRVAAAGFEGVSIVAPRHRLPWMAAREVVFARRPAA